MLSIRKMSYVLPFPRNIEIFKDADFSVEKNQHTIVYGDNGSGKTTLAHILLKFRKPASGYVKGGTDRAAGFFENFDDQLFFSTVYEEITSVVSLDSEIYRYTAGVLGINELLERSTLELSYSEKARLVFGITYMLGKEYMLIDAPPDDDRIEKMIEDIVLNSRTTAVLFLPTGDRRSIREIDRKMIINRGKIRQFDESR